MAKYRTVGAIDAHDQPSSGFWLLWVAASAAGFALGAAAFWAMGQAQRTDAASLVRALAFAVTAVIITTSPGFLHWLILRQRFPRAAWWVPASGIGSVFGFIMLSWGITVADTLGGDTDFWPVIYGWVVPALAAAFGGALAGTMQWFVLRRWVAYAGWWVPVSGISWVVATWAYALVTRGASWRARPSAACSPAP
jgi:hypothetical protein